MRILLATSSYWPRINGVTVSVDTFAQEFRNMGHEVWIFAPKYENSGDYHPREDLFRFTSVVPFMSPEDRLVAPWSYKNLKRVVEKLRPDIIHMQTEFSLEHLLKAIALKKKIPVLQSFHTFFEDYINHYIPWVPKVVNHFLFMVITRNTGAGANYIIAPTKQMAKTLAKVFPKRNIQVVPTGISLPRFELTGPTPPSLVQIKEKIGDAPILLFVGRLGIEKNVQFLFPVLEKLKKKGVQPHLVIIGDGPQRKKFASEAEKLGVHDQVHFMGYLPREDVLHYFHAASIFTFPSKTETQGLVTLESMACGTPVVAIGEMGTLEVMNGDNGGFMVPDDEGVFTEKVQDLLTDKQLYQKKKEDALEYVKGWSSAHMAGKLISLYEKAIQEIPSP